MTDLPILVLAIPREKHDGSFQEADDYDTPVRVLPLSTVDEALLDEKHRAEVEAEYSLKIPKHVLGELLALLRLVEAVRDSTKRTLAQGAYVRLMTAVEQRQEAKHWKELDRLFKVKPVVTSESAVAKRIQKRMRFPLSELMRKLNHKVRSVRLVIWWAKREKTLLPGLYCGGNMAAAVAVALFSRLASTRALAVCARCGRGFIRSKRAQQFCSLRCGNAARKQRERAKKSDMGAKP